LEHAIRDYGFKGAVINGHIQGRYLDDQFFWPILECAEALNVPIYLHPTRPPKSVIDASYSGFSQILTELLSGPGWGWHIETAIHLIRVILGGTFDRFPRFQILIGHMGEALPFMLPRLDTMNLSVTKLNRPISAYLRQNVYYTFSGFNYTPTFAENRASALKNTKSDAKSGFQEVVSVCFRSKEDFGPVVEYQLPELLYGSQLDDIPRQTRRGKRPSQHICPGVAV
jgi:predicted TIM-barrel fold metal-dependent hydrolase